MQCIVTEQQQIHMLIQYEASYIWRPISNMLSHWHAHNIFLYLSDIITNFTCIVISNFYIELSLIMFYDQDRHKIVYDRASEAVTQISFRMSILLFSKPKLSIIIQGSHGVLWLAHICLFVLFYDRHEISLGTYPWFIFQLLMLIFRLL